MRCSPPPGSPASSAAIPMVAGVRAQVRVGAGQRGAIQRRVRFVNRE
jgi:hypothetical protein